MPFSVIAQISKMERLEKGSRERVQVKFSHECTQLKVADMDTIFNNKHVFMVKKLHDAASMTI